MDRVECIRQILSGRDLVIKIEEWIQSREEMNQASVAAANDNEMPLEGLLATLPEDEFKAMIQSLNIGGPLSFTTAGGLASSRKQSTSSEVPSGLNGSSNDDDQETYDGLTTQHDKHPSLSLPSKTKVSNTFALAKEEKLVGHPQKKLPDQNIDDTQKADVYSVVYHSKEDCGRVAEKKDLCDALFQSSLKSVGKKECTEEIGGGKSIPDAAEHSGHIQSIYNLDGSGGMVDRQHSLVQGRQISRTTNEEIVEERSDGTGTEEVAEPMRNLVIPSYNEGMGAVGGTRFPSQHVHVSHPPQPLQQSNLNAPGAQQRPNFQMDHSQIPSETLHAIVQMLQTERQINNEARRSSCSNCSHLEAENNNLRKSNSRLGQQSEQLRWNFILMEQFINTLEEKLRETNQDKKENLRVIRHFHKEMLERKRNIARLEKQSEILKNTHEQELNKKLYELAEKEDKERIQRHEQMKKQNELIEKVNKKVEDERRERHVLKAELEQKCAESFILREENRELKEQLQASEARINKLELRNQALEAEKREETTAKGAAQDGYAIREAELNERISIEIQSLMQVFENLQIYAERHGLRLGSRLNSEAEQE